MTANFKLITGGTVTSPEGFSAGATYAGLKTASNDALDLGILVSEVPCAAAALFTTNSFKAAPVLLCQQQLKDGKATALVVNSGCANAGTGEPGLGDAITMTELTAERLKLPPQHILVASTGVIGQRLPMAKIKAAIAKINLSEDGGHDLARAMMTTDTAPKETAVRIKSYTIGGAAKGSGMIHPTLATMLCFLTTDAGVDKVFLGEALRKATDISFNMVTVDGDTSPNDMVLLLANGRAGSEVIAQNSREADNFQEALNQVCIRLAKAVAADGEGATKLIEVTVSGAATAADARSAARTVAGSSLVKTAVHGSDPNWGRILAAAGRSGARMAASKIDLFIGDICLVRGGGALPFDEARAAEALSGREVAITLDLNLGNDQATAWGCDLSQEYVTINSQYTT